MHSALGEIAKRRILFRQRIQYDSGHHEPRVGSELARLVVPDSDHQCRLEATKTVTEYECTTQTSVTERLVWHDPGNRGVSLTDPQHRQIIRRSCR
jgi:hypothetical protein